jgi:hypothetical protein
MSIYCRVIQDPDSRTEQFKLYQGDFQCRQIFLGCSHDNGYARKLEENATDEVYVQRVTLLEGVPFEKELLGLPFKSKQFPEIFRNTKLVDYGQQSVFPHRNGAAKSYNIYGGLPSRFPPPPSRQVSADGYLQVSMPSSPSVQILVLSSRSLPGPPSWIQFRVRRLRPLLGVRTAPTSQQRSLCSIPGQP